MSDQNASGPTVPDLLLRIMQQQDSGFSEIRSALAEQNKTMNRIDLEVALLKRDTEMMAGVPGRVHALETASALQGRLIADVQECNKEHATRIDDLEETSSVREGWEGFGGKMLYLLGGGVFVAVIGAIAMALRQ